MNIFNVFKRKISHGKKYFPEIDGLRFIAILAVIFYHITDFFSIKNNLDLDGLFFLPFKTGGQGVQLFFIISGFILALPFAEKYPKGENVSIKYFFLRRLTRLEPPYLISLFLFFSILIFTNKANFNDLVDNLIASIFYVHNIVFGKGSDINTVAWSLEVEIQFYIMVPLLAQLFKFSKLKRRLSLTLLFFIFVGLNFLFDIYFRTIIAQFHYFILGFIFADFYVTEQLKAIKNKYFGLVGILIFLLINREDGNLEEMIFIIGCILIFSSVILNDFWNRIFSNKIIAVVGGMCYSIYLLHYPIISFFGNIINQLLEPSKTYYLVLYFIVLIPIIIIISSIFYLMVEKPCMNNKWPQNLHLSLKNFAFNNKKYLFLNKK